MQQYVIRVYWTDGDGANSQDYSSLSDALYFIKLIREAGGTFITSVSENVDQVGAPGASMVHNGTLPNGEQYTWTKDDRVGAAFKNR